MLVVLEFASGGLRPWIDWIFTKLLKDFEKTLHSRIYSRVYSRVIWARWLRAHLSSQHSEAGLLCVLGYPRLLKEFQASPVTEWDPHLKKAKLWVEELTHWIKHLLHKQEQRCLDPQYPYRAVASFVICTVEGRTIGQTGKWDSWSWSSGF